LWGKTEDSATLETQAKPTGNQESSEDGKSRKEFRKGTVSLSEHSQQNVTVHPQSRKPRLREADKWPAFLTRSEEYCSH
jgi:hypothetical protein